MKKYYVAKQIAPEYQQSPMFKWNEFENFETWEDVSFFGNHDLMERKIPAMESFLNYIDDACSAYEELEMTKSVFESIPEIVKYMFTDNANGYCVSDEVAENPLWKRILEDWPNADYNEERTLICLALEAMTGMEYDWFNIHGCCQGEWQVIYIPTKFKEDREMIEAEYFNTGEEYSIFEEPVYLEDDEEKSPEEILEIAENEDSLAYSLYCYGWSKEMILNQISKSIGCAEKDILLFEFDGYKKTPLYKLA